MKDKSHMDVSLSNHKNKGLSWRTILKNWPWMMEICQQGLNDGYNGAPFREWYETASIATQRNYERMRLVGASIKASGYKLNLWALTSSLVGRYFSFFSSLGGIASVPGWANTMIGKAPVRLIGKKEKA